MNKLKQTLIYIQNHPLIIGIALVVVIGYLISLIPNPKKSSFIPTSPLIPSLTPASLTNKAYTQAFSGQSEIRVSDTQSIFAINKEKRLVQYHGNIPQPLTPSGITVVDYKTSGDNIIVESGTKNYPGNDLYYIKPSTKSFSKIDTASLSPVLAYGLSPQENTLAILGKYSTEKQTANLYLYNLSTKVASIAAQKIIATDLSWLDSKHILIVNELKKPVVDKYLIGVFSLPDNKLTIKNIPSLKNTTIFDDKRSLIYFTDTKHFTLSSLDTTNYKFTTILELSILPQDIILDPKSGNIALIINQNNQTIVRSVNPVEKRILQEYVLPLNSQQTYVEHFLSREINYIKIYDRETKKYTIQNITF